MARSPTASQSKKRTPEPFNITVRGWGLGAGPGLDEQWMQYQLIRSNTREGTANGFCREAWLRSLEVQFSVSNYPIKPHQQELAFAWPLPLSTIQEFRILTTNKQLKE